VVALPTQTTVNRCCHMNPKRIGITGNIGSGKSTVAKMLVEKGAVLIDADALAREATNDSEVLEQIQEKLSNDLITDGKLDRAKTAELVFNNPDARKILNSIIHPWVRQKSDERIKELESSSSPPPVILQDIPLLFENGLEKTLEAVIVVYAPLEIRLARVTTRSNMSEKDFYARDAAQMKLEEKVKRADYVIDNSGGLAALHEQVDKLWTVLTDGAGRGV
jgi:dephospho-CoA kinase